MFQGFDVGNPLLLVKGGRKGEEGQTPDDPVGKGRSVCAGRHQVGGQVGRGGRGSKGVKAVRGKGHVPASGKTKGKHGFRHMTQRSQSPSELSSVQVVTDGDMPSLLTGLEPNAFEATMAEDRLIDRQIIDRVPMRPVLFVPATESDVQTNANTSRRLRIDDSDIEDS